MKLIVKTLSGSNLNMDVNETTTIGQIRGELRPILRTGPETPIKVIHQNKVLIYNNDEDSKKFFEHLRAQGLDETTDELTCNGLIIFSPYEAKDRSGVGFIRSQSRRDELESRDENELLSPISLQMIAGDVVKINSKYYGKKEFVDYMISLKTAAESNPSYVPLDPHRNPLPDRLAYAVTGSEVDILRALEYFKANDEYSARVKALDAGSSAGRLSM